MRKNLSFPFLSDAHALYLPDDLNFWTLATVALGSAFLFLVIVTMVVIYRTEPETTLPVRNEPTVNHICPPESTTENVKLFIPIGSYQKPLSPKCSDLVVTPERLMNEHRLTFLSDASHGTSGYIKTNMEIK